MTSKERDSQAKSLGLLICIPDELYMRGVTKHSAIFVEKINSKYDVYRLTWYDNKSRNIRLFKMYAEQANWKQGLAKAKRIIDWFDNLKG